MTAFDGLRNADLLEASGAVTRCKPRRAAGLIGFIDGILYGMAIVGAGFVVGLGLF